MSSYEIRRTADSNVLSAGWDDPVWSAAATVRIDQFRPESSDHRPVVAARVLYNAEGLFTRFRVADRYIRCVARQFNDSVCLDSCVEFFIEPSGGHGYLNFEFSGNGVFLCYHIRDARRSPSGFADYSKPAPEALRRVEVVHSLPSLVEPELSEPRVWELGFFVPFDIFTALLGAARPTAGSVWRGNFFKCADHTSHPHWAAWQAVPELNFHEPKSFGSLIFQP